MIGITENDLGVEFLEVTLGDCLHRALRADRHEGRRVDGAMRRVDDAAPRGTVGVSDLERKHLRLEPEARSPKAVILMVNVKKLRVGVIYGGRSGEHEVSIASAAAVVQNLDKQRYEAIPIRIEKDGRWLIADRLPVSSSAAEVIEQGKTPVGQRLSRGGREAHLLAHPGDEQILTIERGNTPSITGLGLDVVFPVLH